MIWQRVGEAWIELNNDGDEGEAKWRGDRSMEGSWGREERDDAEVSLRLLATSGLPPSFFY